MIELTAGLTKAQMDAGLAGLNDISTAQSRAQADAALAAVDPVTMAEAVILNTKIDAIDAELGIVHTESHDLLHALNHSTSIFPGNTNLTCTLTALATANTFSAWAEIADSGATKLTAAFAALPGHLTEFSIESLSEVDTIYMLEIAYGTPKVDITTIRFAGGTKFQSPDNVQRIWGSQVPAGEKVYYQMKTATAVADTALINIRYHTET